MIYYDILHYNMLYIYYVYIGCLMFVRSQSAQTFERQESLRSIVLPVVHLVVTYQAVTTGCIYIYIYIIIIIMIIIIYNNNNKYIYIYMYICTHIYTYIRTCLPTYLPTYIHTYMHACMHTQIHTCIHTCIHIYIYIYIRNVPVITYDR